MRLRNLLTATAVGALTGALAVGALSAPAHSTTAPPPAGAGSVVTWGDTDNVNAAPAIPVPEDLSGLVTSVAANERATAAVTLDGGLHVWGGAAADEVGAAPTGVTDAVAVALTSQHGAILRADGSITAWGSSALFEDVPADLRATAIALQSQTGYAVRRDGTLATWGASPMFAPPGGLTGLTDVSAGGLHALALHADGTVSTWGAPAPGLLTVPDFGDKSVVEIAAGFGFSAVVLDDGSVATWGPGVPPTMPAFDGETPATTVVDLDLNSFADSGAAVTADGAVHAWGSNADVKTIPGSLTGKPVSAVAVGNAHVAAVVTAFRDLTKPTVAGAPTVGQTLTATPATFSVTPDAPATGQWYADGAPVAGQAGTTLVLDKSMVGKTISYRSSATRGADTVTSTSNGVGPVSLLASATSLTVSPASGQYGTVRTATATVSKAGGTPGGSVVFTLGGTQSTATLTNGTATWTLPKDLAVGDQTLVASYQGDATTAASTSAAATVTVTKAASKVTASKPKAQRKNKRFATKVRFTVTVTSAEGVSPAGKVTVTLKGKTTKKVVVKVDAKGKARVSVPKLRRGRYQATLTYTGNAQVSAAKATAKFKV